MTLSLASSQMSAVHGIPSLIGVAVTVQPTPGVHTSIPLQNRPSSQYALLGALMTLFRFSSQ